MKNTKLQNPSLRKRKGFTLIELIVVIAILAILAAIAIPTFLGTLQRAEQRADEATCRVIESAARVGQAETGSLPTTTTILTYLENGVCPPPAQKDLYFTYNPTSGDAKVEATASSGYTIISAKGT